MPPVNVIDNEGAIYSLPSEQLDAALAQGYQQATPEQIAHYDRVKESRGTMLGQAQAGFSAAANQLTLGAFNPLLEHFSPERAEQMRIAQEANSGATTAGNVAGFAGTVVNPLVGLATKPASIAGEAVTKVIPGALGNIAGKTLEGGIAGATLGAPKAAAEASTGNYEDAAETLLASGKYGGAFGFLFGAAQSGVRASTPAAKNFKEFVTERTEEALQNQQVKALGAIQSDVSKLTPEKIDRIVAKAEAEGLYDVFQTRGSRLAKVEALADKAGAAKAQAIDDMTAAGITLDTTPIIDAGYNIAQKKGQFANAGKPYVDAVNDFSEDILNLPSPTPKALDEFKMTLGPEGWDGFGRPIETPKGYVAREFYGAIKQEIIDSAKKAAQGSPLAEKFLKASEDYDIFGDLERWALRAKNRGANQGLKLSDFGAAVVGGQLGGAAGMLKGFILNNARHEFGNAAMVRTLQGTLKAGETVSDFIQKWGPRALDPKVTRAAKIGASNAVRELTGEDDDQKATEQVVNNLSQFATNPSHAAETLSQSVPQLSQTDPRIASALHQKTMALAQALLDVAPKKAVAVSPFETDTGYTTAQIRDFNKKIAVAMNPLSVMKDLAAGRLDPDSTALIRKIYPNLYQQMQQSILDHATSNPRPYTYQQKMNLSMFVGSPVDTIGQPQNIQAFQANFAKKEKQPNKSRRQPKSAENAQTDSQRIEQR